MGKSAILFNYFHHDVQSPYRSCGPVFVGVDSKKAVIEPNELPEIIHDERRFSLRSYDKYNMMVIADVVLGKDLAYQIIDNFKNSNIEYMQVHFAAPGCWVFDVKKVVFK